MKEITFNAGEIILENNQNSKNIFFLCQGRIDVFQSKRSKFALFSMQNTEYFGESGFLTSIKPGRQRHLILEEYLYKANTRVEVLILPYEEFHLIDRETTDIISNYFLIKKEWRQDRCEELSRESIANDDFQRSLKRINKKEKEKVKEKVKEEKSDAEVIIELSLSSVLTSSVPESISSTLSASSTSSYLSPISSSLSLPASSSLSCSEADDLIQSLTSDTITPLLISSSSSSSSSSSLTCSSSFTIITLPSQSLSTPSSSSSSSSAPEGQESELLFKNSKIILPSKSSNSLNRGDIQNIDHNISRNHRYERENLILRNDDKCLPNSNNIRYQNVDDIGHFNREPSIPNREHGRAFPTYHMNPSAIQSSRTYRPSSAYSLIKNTSKNRNQNNVPIVPLGSVSLRVKKSTWLFDLPEINVSENNAFEPLLVVGGTRGVTSHGVSRTKDNVIKRKFLVK